ncbi:MAG: cation:proton antiporter [Phycisphaerales bacterium]|nr:MAG: cation:proton antiporter [Phycisphaerales bacterium]
MFTLAFEIVPIASLITLNMLAVAMLIAMVRLLRGPSLADRVVALDLIAALAVGVITVYSIYTNQTMLLRAGIVVALVVFVGTVAFAMYLEKRAKP